MFSPKKPTADEVVADLGSAIVADFVKSVDDARDEYASIRQRIPASMAVFTSRTTANIIHDLIWKYLQVHLQGKPDVQVIDREPRQELVINGRYQVRIKRHTDNDQIASYPTDAALAFWAVADGLPGLERFSLALGYYWDNETRVFGDAVISFRETLNKPIWAIRLYRDSSNVAGFSYKAIEPALPEVDLTGVAWDEKSGSES